jgi:hypothetical protein
MRAATTMTTAALALAALSGCVVVSDDHHEPHPQPAYVNYMPEIAWADSGCYWDDYNHDFIWWFDAGVYDANGRQDIVAVYADVYDYQGHLIDSFELYPEMPDPDEYYSDWLQHTTYLDCYRDDYVVDFVAYDTFDEWDVASVYPSTY